jgi:hypothetical protein
MAELVGGRVARATAWTETLNPGTALAAELHLLRIVMTTLRTPHDASPQREGPRYKEKEASIMASATPGCLWTTPQHCSTGGKARARTPT